MKKRHTPERIILKLRQAQTSLTAAANVPEVARKLEIGEATYYRWKNQYDGMSSSELKHLKELEKENARLKKVVAEQALDIQMLKEVSRKKF